MKKLIEVILLFQRKLKNDRVDVYSAQASFYIIMSAVPILMLLFMMLKYTPLNEEMMMEALKNILNEEVISTVQDIVGHVYRGSITILSFAAVSLMWVAGKGIMGLTNGLNNIHRLKENRNYLMLRLRASLYTLLLVAAFILAFGVLVFGYKLQAYLCILMPFFETYQEVLIYLQTLIALCLLSLIFTALYVFLPNRTKSFSSQLPGGIFATLAWCIFSYFFSIYLSYAHNISVIYGGLVTLVVLMLWLYFCMYLWFLGAEINAYLEKPLSFFLEEDS